MSVTTFLDEASSMTSPPGRTHEGIQTDFQASDFNIFRGNILDSLDLQSVRIKKTTMTAYSSMTFLNCPS